MPERISQNTFLCFFIVQGHLEVKFAYQKYIFSHRLHIPSIKRNYHGILDILISVHCRGFLSQCVKKIALACSKPSTLPGKFWTHISYTVSGLITCIHSHIFPGGQVNIDISQNFGVGMKFLSGFGINTTPNVQCLSTGQRFHLSIPFSDSLFPCLRKMSNTLQS